MTGGPRSCPGVVIDAKSAFPKSPPSCRRPHRARRPVKPSASRMKASIFSTRNCCAADEFRGNALGNGAFMGGAPRNIRAEKTSEMVIGDIVSGLYVAKYSSPRVKTIAQAMAENMRQALDAHLQALSWMGPASRAKAREKLARMHILIGYPEHFDDYAGLEIDDHDLYGNYVRSAAYQWQVLVHRLRRPYDQSQWSVRPSTDFSYTPTSNTVENRGSPRAAILRRRSRPGRQLRERRNDHRCDDREPVLHATGTEFRYGWTLEPVARP